MLGKDHATKLSSIAMILAIVTAGTQAQHEQQAKYYETNTFSVTEFDRVMYLRNAPPEAGGGIGTRARNLQALSDLYAIKILAGDASNQDLLSEQEAQWLADYAIEMELIKRYLDREVAKRIDATDWSSEALEQYLAATEVYRIPETVTIRTLLIRTEARSESEALSIVEALRVQALQSSSDFAAIVSEHTEDEGAVSNGGLMSGVQRGQTVAPFEQAAFAMREPGEISQPVVSEFGVHLIQLLEYTPYRQLTFNEAEQRIIKELKPVRERQYRTGIQDEARERQPEGFVQHTDALDALVAKTSDGALGPQFDASVDN